MWQSATGAARGERREHRRGLDANDVSRPAWRTKTYQTAMENSMKMAYPADPAQLFDLVMRSQQRRRLESELANTFVEWRKEMEPKKRGEMWARMHEVAKDLESRELVSSET